MIDDLTPRVRDVYEAVKSHIEEKHYPPTYREISRITGHKSIATVFKHMDTLKHLGYLDWDPKLKRTIRVLK